MLTHAEPADVEGRRVIGVLPHRLSVLAASVVEVPVDVPAELRGVELTLEQVRQYAGEPAEYVVRRLAIHPPGATAVAEWEANEGDIAELFMSLQTGA